ncbi:MAG: DoxX family protein [Emcibacter sp.]|nr:DoxX family protein [Emcibacter sp.]
MTKYQELAAPVGRLFISLIFLLSGIGKISGYEGTQGYMEAMGVPGALLPVTIVFEIGFSLAIIVGWKTRIAALALAGFSVVSALIFHFNLADQMQFIMFMKNFAIAGGFLFLVAHGAGAYSLDNRLRNKA